MGGSNLRHHVLDIGVTVTDQQEPRSSGWRGGRQIARLRERADQTRKLAAAIDAAIRPCVENCKTVLVEQAETGKSQLYRLFDANRFVQMALLGSSLAFTAIGFLVLKRKTEKRRKES